MANINMKKVMAEDDFSTSFFVSIPFSDGICLVLVLMICLQSVQPAVNNVRRHCLSQLRHSPGAKTSRFPEPA